MSSLVETREVLRQASQVFAGDDDVKSIEKIAKINKENKAARTAELDSVQSLIRGL